jgi:hypothetical protein
MVAFADRALGRGHEVRLIRCILLLSRFGARITFFSHRA